MTMCVYVCVYPHTHVCVYDYRNTHTPTHTYGAS